MFVSLIGLLLDPIESAAISLALACPEPLSREGLLACAFKSSKHYLQREI
jgi:hypothetical protein